ncbi:unnamed protein product [Camellia sinensis]
MQRETLAPSSSSYSTSSSSAIRAPPEDAWVDAHQRLLPQWQSLTLSPQSERAWRDLDSLLLRNFGTVLPLLVVNISGPVYNHFLLSVDGVILSRSLPRRAWILIQRIEGIFKAASFGNLLIFLYTRRSTKSKTCLWSPNMNRAVSFEYMNRQLVWNEFSEMLLLLLPLINSSSIKKFLHPFSKDKSSSSEGDDTTCPICLASPTIPFLAHSCQHRTIVITAFEHGVLRLHHSGAPDAMSQLLPCSGMVA